VLPDVICTKSEEEPHFDADSQGDGMSAFTLHRSDPAKNLRRFYRLDVQPDLFGQWCFIREWGRIDSSGQTRSVPYPPLSPA
jgi:hypothetical protein